MKNFCSIIFLLFASIVAMAQATEIEDENIIYIDVPAKMKINDKIILQNKSQYSIIQAVVVLADTKQSIGSSTYVNPGESCEMASYDHNWLRNVRGKKIAIKVKGVKKILKDSSSTGIAGGSFATGGFGVGVRHTELKADEINNIDPSLITYDFNATISEANHDLYITIMSGNSENPLDF